ncbi:MAG: hypothetical protein LUC92_02350 [Clostridiales bacterium]|nr:hypothetical protein [Clostridiales bacterium]
MAERRTGSKNKKSNSSSGTRASSLQSTGKRSGNVIKLSDVRSNRTSSAGRTTSRTARSTGTSRSSASSRTTGTSRTTGISRSTGTSRTSGTSRSTSRTGTTTRSTRTSRTTGTALTPIGTSRTASRRTSSTGSSLTARRSSAVSKNTSQARTASAAAPKRKPQTRVVHKKVSGIGYEGAARIFLAVFLVLSVLYIGGNIIRYALKSAVSYDTIQIGSIDTPKSADGVIIRTETAYQSDMEGEISFLVPDGEKVRTGETIATVKVKDVVDEAQQSLDSLNEDYIESEKVKETIDETNEEAVKLNLEIKALADDAAMDFVALDTISLRDFTNNAMVKQEMRNQAILSGSRSAEETSAIQKAENTIAENSRTYTALEGGIVCLETDGLESELNTGNMANLSENDIKQSSDSSHVAGSEVSEGENIFKIITSNVWYIAAYIDSDYVLDWEQGDRHTIYLTDSMGENIEMDVVVETFVPDTKKTYMVLRASKYMLDFMSVRNLSFEIDKVKTGYKIANSSIVETTLIKIPVEYVTAGTVTKSNGTTVSVGSVKGDYAYFPVGYDSLALGDIIMSPDGSDTYTLSEVETRQGIYIMNTGIAQLYTIDTEGSTSNSTHTILDPDRNTNLSIYDRVVVDPKNIEEDQMLYK